MMFVMSKSATCPTLLFKNWATCWTRETFGKMLWPSSNWNATQNRVINTIVEISRSLPPTQQTTGVRPCFSTSGGPVAVVGPELAPLYNTWKKKNSIRPPHF
uniref:Uncharacterized protein n=1 Tax=Cacopsylla melanoneura TaxID=428564 RepID=A0A8D8SAH6_9HEMI